MMLLLGSAWPRTWPQKVLLWEVLLKQVGRQAHGDAGERAAAAFLMPVQALDGARAMMRLRLLAVLPLAVHVAIEMLAKVAAGQRRAQATWCARVAAVLVQAWLVHCASKLQVQPRPVALGRAALVTRVHAQTALRRRCPVSWVSSACECQRLQRRDPPQKN